MNSFEPDTHPSTTPCTPPPAPPELFDALDTCGAGHIVHVAGGDGTLIGELLTHRSTATGVLCDSSEVLATAPLVLAAAGVDHRVDVATVEAEDALPLGGDVYLIDRAGPSDTGPDLARCRVAMAPAARLIVMQRTPTLEAEHSAPDLIDQLARAGFEIDAASTTDSGWTVVVARPDSQ